MNFIRKLTSLAENKESKIGIGLGVETKHNLKILNASLQFLNKFISKIFLFGNSQQVSNLKENPYYKKEQENLLLIDTQEPETQIISMLKNGELNAVIRGSLSANKFLPIIKKEFNLNTLNRMALLEDFNGNQFFFGPVGIDECDTFERKIEYIKDAIEVFKNIGISAKISVLSGGRLGDIGRSQEVDKSIQDAENIVDQIKSNYQDLVISHDEILIESSIKKKANLIIAPDGISGNLIYRTLVHLGGGKAYGALYNPLFLKKNMIIIDTSRVGHLDEIKGGLVTALALTKGT